MTRQKTMIIGLTGGIGTGKSTAAKILSGMGFPVHSADEAVHRLLDVGGAAVRPIARLFPTALRQEKINRQILGQLVFGRPDLLKQLEDIVHPLVQRDEREFLRVARREKARAVILEIPLLYETGAEQRCDVVLCMTASRAVQKARVLRRKGMTVAKFNAIIKHQMPEADKKRRADFIITSGESRADVRHQLRHVVEQIGLAE